jgi:ATP/maltotriose-dependent transcriptional regulator MalT
VLGNRYGPASARESLVARDALVSHVRELTTRRLTTIAAPTGYGKTTLLTQWLEVEERPVAWLSLEPDDNDPTRLWLGVLEAFETVRPGIVRTLAPSLRRSGEGRMARALALLVNELSLLDRQAVLVLDDFHVLSTSAGQESIASFVRYVPDTVRVVISTRSDPPLPLGRLRANGELGEIRSDELRFRLRHIDQLLRTSVDLALSESDLRLLEARTEGWPAGCYLAALSLRGCTDQRRFLTRFGGTDRHVFDYLASEVLRSLPESDQTFLLRSSILGRLTGPICDAVLQRSGSSHDLQRLEATNMFLIPLDDERACYRYHRLFAELLRFELAQREPESLAGLHSRAAIACEQAGVVTEAVDHAVAAEDFELARDIILRHWVGLTRAGHHETVRLLLARLDPGWLEQEAGLALAAAWMESQAGAARPVIDRWLEIAEHAPMSEASPLWSRSRELELAVVRISSLFDDVGRYVADSEDVVRLARQLPPSVAREHTELIGGTSLAYGLFLAGRAEDARIALDDAPPAVAPSDAPVTSIVRAAVRSLVEQHLGRPASAASAGRAAIELVERFGLEETLPKVGLAYTAMGKVLAGEDRLGDAEALLEKGVSTRELPAGNLGHAHACLELALVRARREQELAARRLLSQARAAIDASPDPGMLPMLAEEVELLLGSGPEPAAYADLLSRAEVRVLRRLATSMTQREIARDLYLSLNTIKSHVRGIYQKLGVASRSEALEVARQREFI